MVENQLSWGVVGGARAMEDFDQVPPGARGEGEIYAPPRLRPVVQGVPPSRDGGGGNAQTKYDQVPRGGVN